MAGNENSRFGWFGWSRKRKLCQDLPRAIRNYVRHGRVRADRSAIKQGFIAPPQVSIEGALLVLLPKAQHFGNDLLAEKTVADEQRRQKDARTRRAFDDLLEIGFLFPECFAHLVEEAAPAQFGTVLEHGRARLFVHS